MTYGKAGEPSGEWPLYATGEFRDWFDSLTQPEAIAVDAKIQLLAERGPWLGRPFVDTLKQSRHAKLKELRISHRGAAYRVLFAFDPRRAIILLLGGRKTDGKWYKGAIPAAEKLYDEYLEELRKRGTIQ